MKRSIGFLWTFLLAALPFAVAAWLYPGLPERIPTHFGPSGRPDAWGGRESIFLGPSIMGIVSIFTYVLLTNLGRIDPKRGASVNVGLMRGFAVFMSGFLSLLCICILLATAHPSWPVFRVILPAIGIGITGIGLFLPRLEPNYFAGLRFPWTLEDPGNWASTHRLGGRVWTVGGMLVAVTGLLPPGDWQWVVFIGVMVLLGLVPLVHSWRYYRKGR